jgi:hypothetical protein
MRIAAKRDVVHFLHQRTYAERVPINDDAVLASEGLNTHDSQIRVGAADGNPEIDTLHVRSAAVG